MQLYKTKVWEFQIIGLLLLNAFTANSADAQSSHGLKFKDSPELNVGAVYSLLVTETYQVDSGACQGPVYLHNLQTYTRNYTAEAPGRAVFISRTTLPTPGLRVVIRNVTPGIDQTPSPYTDREYDKTSTSEEFKVNVSANHRSRYLAVREGKNDFSYEIKRANTVIESGSFTTTIYRQTRTIERSQPASLLTDKDTECQRAYDEENKRDRNRH